MYDKENVFAKIIKGEIPCDKVYQDKNVLAFRDLNPVAPVHVLVVPKGKYTSFDDFANKAGEEAVGEFFIVVREIANDLGLAKGGYRIITNHGNDASQSIPHFHVHIIGGKKLVGLIPGDSLNR